MSGIFATNNFKTIYITFIMIILPNTQYLAIKAYLNLCCIEEFVFDLTFFIHMWIFNKSVYLG